MTEPKRPVIIQKRPEVVKITLSAMLVALNVIIIVFMPKVTIGFWSGTLASHVPQIIAIFLGPFSAAAVAVGAAVTFTFTLNIVVGMRAFTHIFFSLTAWLLLRRGVNRYVALAVVAPIHALAEILVVYIFAPDSSAYSLWIATGIFTMIHHFVDCAIAFPVLEAIHKTRLVGLIGFGRRKNISE